ncbi:MAG: ATP-binding protein, partial [Candidatus Magasanikbacteria bacterium]
SLAGRKYIYQLYPFNFDEFLRLKGADIKVPDNHDSINESIFKSVNKYYWEYIEYGGFPQVIKKEDKQEKEKTLEDIFTSYFQFEVEQLSQFRKVSKLRDLILLLSSRVGKRLNINKLANELKISRDTVNEYISFLESTYLISLIDPYSQSKDVEIRKSPKLYMIDSGLANYIADINQGSVFEQNIFQLLRKENKINYYQKKSGTEIDFIINEKKAFEVKTNPREKHLNKLKKLSNSLGFDSYEIVSREYTELTNTVFGFEL